MPKYPYIEENSGLEVEIARAIEDRDLAPTIEELILLGVEISQIDVQNARWKRKIASNIGKSRTKGYGVKGRW